jgi:hypothetical protein
MLAISTGVRAAGRNRASEERPCRLLEGHVEDPETANGADAIDGTRSHRPIDILQVEVSVREMIFLNFLIILINLNSWEWYLNTEHKRWHERRERMDIPRAIAVRPWAIAYRRC